jgi:hypothetical protein
MADDASNLAKANTAAAAPKGDPSTHFLFAHKLFAVNGAYFGISPQTDEPVFNVTLGELKAALTLPTLAQEFSLEPDGSDGKLLSIIAKSLRFVKEIRPGDSIPRELLDGTCSWTLEPHHHAVARARLTVNLTAWISGEEAPTSDPELLRSIADDAETKQRLNDALGEVAEKLGYGRDRKGKVLDQIEEVARELAYIEALRDRCGKVKMIERKIADAAKLYRRERALSEEIQRIQVLLRPPIGEFDPIFEKVDMQTSEVLHVLRKIRQQIDFIRAQRDELHTRLMRWDEMIALWEPIPSERCDAIENALRTTYRFLARYFPQRSDWTLNHNKR